MADRIIHFEWKVNGVLTDVGTSIKLSDPTGAYGVREVAIPANITVDDDTTMTAVPGTTGQYEYTFDDTVNIAYEGYVEVVHSGATYYIEQDIPARGTTDVMTCSYNTLKERVGHYLFGLRSGFSGDQVSDIDDCIKDGLRDTYAAHDWSFFRPLEDVTTTAPYSTGTVTVASGVVTGSGTTFPSWAADGVIKVSNSYYSIASRDSDTQLTLDDTTVTAAAGTSYSLGRPEIPLAAAFEAVSKDSDLTYYPGPNEIYPAVKWRADQSIRQYQQIDPYYDRPYCYSVRTVEFDPTVGSRKVLAFYPVPDAAYTMRVPMILRPTMIDATNLYPVGGETLAQVITEACLAAAERNFEEREQIHTKRFMELLPMAIAADVEKSKPTSLGPDDPRDERRRHRYLMDEYSLREQRIGTLTLDGTDQ